MNLQNTRLILFHDELIQLINKLNLRIQTVGIKLILKQGQGKGKCNFPCALPKHHAMKAYWRSGGIAPRII